MDSFIIIILIVFCSLALLGTMFILIVYSGLFTHIEVSAGPPPIENARVLYKSGVGSYKNTGPIFTEVTSIAPRKKSFGIYYDDPDQVPTDKLRWVVGVILAEGNTVPDKNLETKFKKEGYTDFAFPLIQNAVKATFPCPTQISVLLGIYMVYPKLGAYVKERKLCAHPWIEIYDGENIHYMAPLSKQDQFYVPETRTVKDPQDSKDHHKKMPAKRQKEPSTVKSQEGSKCTSSSGDLSICKTSTSCDKHSHTLISTASDCEPKRSKSAHPFHHEKLLNNEARSASMDAANNRERIGNSTPIRLPQLDSLTDESKLEGEESLELDSSMCSCSSFADSDISTASSYYSSDFSCSSVNTMHNSSVNCDPGKSDTENVGDNKLSKEI